MSLLDKIGETFTKDENKNYDKKGTGMKIVLGVIILSLVLFSLALFWGYVADDLISPAASEQSVPADTN